MAVFCKKLTKISTSVDLNCVSLSFLAVQCPALQELENGFTSCGDDVERKFSYGNSCNFSCAPGYHLVGSTTIMCTSAAVWTESAPRCAGESSLNLPLCAFQTVCSSFMTNVFGIFSPAITCKNPGGNAPLISECSHPLAELQPGSTCSFHCEAGFELQGAATIQCSGEGQWNKATPTCKGMKA